MTTGLLSWNARHFNNKLSVCEPPDEKKLPKNSELVIFTFQAATIRRFPPASLQHNRIPPFQSDEATALTMEDSHACFARSLPGPALPA
ncbi:protein of unknown function [Pseudomonas sp. JV551A1]|uniref:Uncharacterized protein n=1 Tax=Pseudomonas inefficax TaxID=2078786 RepID=A0AAQ1P8X4_9PSED|nr:protein of unknown function [Pseudomonas sp. JV551A1]SPO60661.1 protein of unknown function [Pseudomonas inefficax]